MKFTRREVVSSGGGDLFVKIKDGESVVGIFRGEVYEFYSKWEGRKGSIVDKSDPDGKPRFRVNFVTTDAGQWVAKIFEFGIMVYNQLADINEDAELPSTLVKVTRRGTGTDTTYSVIPSLKQALTTADWAAIQALPLKSLEHKTAPRAPSPQQYASVGLEIENDEIPF